MSCPDCEAAQKARAEVCLVNLNLLRKLDALELALRDGCIDMTTLKAHGNMELISTHKLKTLQEELAQKSRSIEILRKVNRDLGLRVKKLEDL